MTDKIFRVTGPRSETSGPQSGGARTAPESHVPSVSLPHRYDSQNVNKRGLYATASISRDYWGDTKEDWGSGGRKSLNGVQGRSPGRGSGGVPQKLKFFL